MRTGRGEKWGVREPGKKRQKIYRAGKVMRGKIAKEIRVRITLRSVSPSRTPWQDWTHIETCHLSTIQATPSSALVFVLPRIFHCWQVATTSNVECQYDTVPTLIWQQTQQGVRVGYDNWRSHVWPVEWPIIILVDIIMHRHKWENSSIVFASFFGNCSKETGL